MSRRQKIYFELGWAKQHLARLKEKETLPEQWEYLRGKIAGLELALKLLV